MMIHNELYIYIGPGFNGVCYTNDIVRYVGINNICPYGNEVYPYFKYLVLVYFDLGV